MLDEFTHQLLGPTDQQAIELLLLEHGEGLFGRILQVAHHTIIMVALVPRLGPATLIVPPWHLSIYVRAFLNPGSVKEEDPRPPLAYQGRAIPLVMGQKL